MYKMLFILIAMIGGGQTQRKIIDTWILVSYKSNSDFKGWFEVDLEIIDIISMNSMVIKKKSSKNLDRLQFKFESDSLNLYGDKYDVTFNEDHLVLTNSYHILNFARIDKKVPEISRVSFVDYLLNNSFTYSDKGSKTTLSFHNQDLTSFYFGEEFRPGKIKYNDKLSDCGWSVFKYEKYVFLKLIMDSTFKEVHYQILSMEGENVKAFMLDSRSIVRFEPI